MATLELQRPPQPQRPAPISSSSRRSSSLSSAPPTPCSPTIIRTPDFILLPSVPTHEPEDNLPSPMALQHQFAIAAHNDAQARRSRRNSIRNSSSSDEARMAATCSRSSSSSNNSPMMHDHDELEEIVEPESYDVYDPAASHDALRDIRNQQLDSLQTIVRSIAEAHFDSSAPNADITQILDDLFASLRRIEGHNAPLSPTFARSAASGVNQMSDIDRLVLLVDRLSLAYAQVADARQAGLLANLNTVAQGLVASERRLVRAALESPPGTPRALAAALRRRSAHSPQSSAHLSGSRGSFSSIRSYATLSTSSDEATPVAGSDVREHKVGSHARSTSSPATTSNPFDLPSSSQAASLSAVPEQQHIDGSTFDMATVRKTATSRPSPGFSLETLYAPQPSALCLISPQSPRSDQASRAASVGERSDSTALPNRRRYSVQTDSAASIALPSYDAVGKSASQAEKTQASEFDGLPQYDPSLAAAGFSADVKKPLEAPTLLERRRAKLAAQHSAYAARTPEDLAMVQSSIDRLSTVMPQLDNQRVLSPEEQREAQLQHMIGRLAESSSKRLNDQRSNPPSLRASRPAPLPQTSVEPAPAVPAKSKPVRQLPHLGAVSDLPRKGILIEPASDVPKTPTTPASVHSASSWRRSSLLPGAFARKISISSIGNALRRASIYDTTKVKPKEVAEHTEPAGSAAANDDGHVTVRRRAATHDSRANSDIADGLASLFNDGKARKGSIPDTLKAAKRASQSFHAIDFADDTPRGRDASLMPRASLEEEDDSMLDDYSFATIDTTTSNHRLSLLPEPPRSPASWGSSVGSQPSLRRSSQLTTSNPATPTWPKSPLTPISPVASKRSPTGKPTVSFAADTLQPPPAGRATAASLQSQLRENGSQLRPRKCPPCPVISNPPRDTVCASAAAAAAAAAATFDNDLIVYAFFGASSQSNAADPLVRPCTSSSQSDSSRVDLEYFVEAQHALGSISVMLWIHFAVSDTDTVEVDYEVVDSRTLVIVPVNGKVDICVPCESSESGTSSSGEQRGVKRKQVSGHVRSDVRVELPAAAEVPQMGRVVLQPGKSGGAGAVCRIKLTMTEAERDTGAQESRAEGMVEWPLSAVELATGAIQGIGCAVCFKSAPAERASLLKVQSGSVRWRALPSEGWQELADAWMCHADQELNRSLTETAVKFSSKVQAGKSEDEERIEGEEAETVWVGDTYFLIPKRLFEVSTVVFEERQDDQQTVMRCTRCSNVLGEMSSSATAGNATTVKLSKYMVEPLSSSTPKSTNTWVATLLAALQYSAASHGSRRFLIQPSSPSATDQQGVEAWLFSRALFTTSLTRHWSTLQGQVGESVWKGHRLFYRTPSASTETEAAETIELSPPIYRWMLEAMSQCNSSLPSELSKVLPLWNTAYLARSVDEEQ